MKITEIFVQSGEVIERDMNADELAQYELDVERDAERATDVAAKESARQAVLDRLGITSDEVKLLLS